MLQILVWSILCCICETLLYRKQYVATFRESYVQYLCALDWQLDLYLYKHGNVKQIRPTKFDKPTKCIRMGSLDSCMRWTQWQIEFEPHMEWCALERCRGRRERLVKKAKE